MTEEEIQELKERVDKLEKIISGIVIDLIPKGKVVKLNAEEMKKNTYVGAISNARENIGR